MLPGLEISEYQDDGNNPEFIFEKNGAWWFLDEGLEPHGPWQSKELAEYMGEGYINWLYIEMDRQMKAEWAERHKTMVNWVIQEYMLGDESHKEQIKAACEKFGYGYKGIKYPPFTLITHDKLEIEFGVFPSGNNVFWGCTNIQELHPCPGIFFDPEKFTMEQYLNHWGDHMLNAGAEIMQMRDLAKLQGQVGPWFIRPNDDNKSFCGGLMEWPEIEEWLNTPSRYDNDGLILDSKIMVGKPLNMMDEIRCLVVDGRFVTASYYRKNKKLHYERIECFRRGDCLHCCLSYYVNARCKEYMPHDTFVMDIAAYPLEIKTPEAFSDWKKTRKFIPGVGYSQNEFYIIEAGCFNCCGFYDMNIEQIVKQVSKYRESLIEEV